MSKMLPDARNIALRRIEKLRAERNGQPASEQFLAADAARYVGATPAKVLDWMRGRP